LLYRRAPGVKRLTCLAVPLLTLSFCLYCRRTLAGFLRRRWLRFLFIRSSFPVPVIWNRAAAPL
jgi:hypothetical protein